MIENIETQREKIANLISESEANRKRSAYKHLKPSSAVLLLALVLLLGGFLVFNNSDNYLPDEAMGPALAVLSVVFLGYGLYSAFKVEHRMTKKYSNDEVNALIRETLGDLPEIKALSDEQLNAHFDPLHDYLATDDGRRYGFDESKYALYLNSRGLNTNEDIVSLLFDVQRLYFAKQ